jgi:hypothetical protein
MMRGLAWFGVGLIIAAVGARADVTMSYGTAVPVVNEFDQANFVDDATIPGTTPVNFNGQAFSDNAGPPGQTFTAPATAGVLAMSLNSFSLKGANTGGGNSGGNVFTAGTTWSLRLSSVSGTTLTPIRTYSAIPTVTGALGNEWFTWTFTGADRATLTPGTQYAVEAFSSAGYLGFDAGLDPASYTGGFAFNSTGAARQFSSDTAQDRGYDRTFHADISNVPEPGTVAVMCVGAIGLLLRRRG